MQTRAVVLSTDSSSFHKKFELKEAYECPPVSENCALVKIKACGLSVTKNKVFETIKLVDKREDPRPVGQEISGIIIQVGSAVTKFSVGDEVVGVIPFGSLSAGCASFCVISEDDLVHKPLKVGHVDAAGCIGDGVKAYTALHYLARMCAGETVLILDGATSSGIIMIQLAQAWGAKVITTACSEENVLFLEGLQPPVAVVIDLRKRKNLIDVCLDETAGLGVDCVIDSGVVQYSEEFKDEIENDSSSALPLKHELISCLSVGGRWITSQCNLQLDPPDSQMLFLKGASVCFLFQDTWTLSRAQQGRYLHILSDLMEKLLQGVIRPVIHHTVSIEDACSTLQQLSRHTLGKVVVKM